MIDSTTTNSNALNKPPKPNVIRLNHVPIYLIGALFGLLFIGTFIMFPERHTKAIADDTEIATVANSTNKDWYKVQSNALPPHRIIPTTPYSQDHLITRPLAEKDEQSHDTAPNSQSAEALLAAMNSPIKTYTPGATMSEPVSQESSYNSLPVTTPTETVNDLPLSSKQVDKLQKLFGLNSGVHNQQITKQNIIRNQRDLADVNYLPEKVSKPLSPYEIKAGTIIPAVMISGINSDLPGQAIAQVRQNVYDTVSGKYLLLPQGAKLLVIYNSQVAYGQNRVLVAVKRIIFPNGNSLDLEGMPGTDIRGYAGFHDQVNNHYSKIFGGAALLGAISAGFQLSQPQQSSILVNPTTGQTMAAAMGQQMGQVSINLINKNLNVQPTLNIRPGYEFNVTVTADLVLPGPYRL